LSKKIYCEDLLVQQALNEDEKVIERLLRHVLYSEVGENQVLKLEGHQANDFIALLQKVCDDFV
jgi:hypothetical protein